MENTTIAPTVGPKPARYKPARSYPAGHFRSKDKDPLRGALADALAESKQAHERVERQRAGIDRARASVRSREAVVKAAEKGMQEARETHAAAIADAATADAAPPTSGVRAARLAATDAADELEAAKAALAQLKADLPNLIENAHSADVAVEAAISAILAPEVTALLVRARAVQKLFAPLRAALWALFADAPYKAPTTEYFAVEKGQRPLAESRAQVTAFFEEIRATPPAVNMWREARERLRAEPFAPISIAPIPTSDEPAAHP